jgi:uncharacterized membrane protein
MHFILFIITLLFISSCASRPKLYPNSKLKSVGKKISEQEIDSCMQEADEYLESDKYKRVANSAGKGAVAGAIVGGVVGLLTGDVKSAVKEGAIVGGASSAATKAVSPDEVKRSYVNKCLSQKGYEVIGWD